MNDLSHWLFTSLAFLLIALYVSMNSGLTIKSSTMKQKPSKQIPDIFTLAKAFASMNLEAIINPAVLIEIKSAITMI